MQPEQVTLARGTIHNPNEARHFMKLKPRNRRVRVYFDGDLIAQTNAALYVLEVGRDLYDAALYVPPTSLIADMSSSETSTHCPLKGDASYLDLNDDRGMVVVPDVAWVYANPFPFAEGLRGLVSFNTDHVTIEESPL